MLDYLIRHAVDNVWCSPDQDYQNIIQLARLSQDFGAISMQRVMWERIPLPTSSDRYDVFQIGHVHPKLLGLMTLGKEWKSLATVINETVLMSEVYLSTGIVYPRSECWLRYDQHRNIVLAVKQLKGFPKLAYEIPYFRVYTNAYFNSARADASIDGTEVDGTLVTTSDDVLRIQRKYHAAKVRQGAAMAYHNGWLVQDLIPSAILIGDFVEYVWDSSVYRVLDFPIQNLDVFESILDIKRKYLLNSNEDNNDFIDFEDDIDLYLIRPGMDGRYDGVYYHRNQKDSIRMVTHKDYSVPVQRISAYQEAHVDRWPDVNELVLRLYIRRAGFERPLIMDHNRVFELYRMDDETVRGAMLGVDSTIPEWRAENLENSAYVKLMRHRNDLLDPILVQQAYGYNSISRLLGDTPTKVDRSTIPARITMPPALQENSTVYEYDADGLMIGRYYHSVGLTYTCRNNDTDMVEVIGGEASQFLDASFGQESVNVDSAYNYRAYLCTLFGTEPAWDWVDVSNSDLIAIGSGMIQFDIDPTVDYPAVLSDKQFLGYGFTMDDKNGVYKFTITQYETHFTETELRIATIPPRRIDLWLNGHPLIEALDYYLNWPEVTIVNKEFLRVEDPQYIEVRGTGFCNSDLTLDAPRESGFVEHGYLSHDHRYDVRDDKVVSVVVGGRLQDRKTLSFAEDNLGVAIAGTENGKPYTVRETIVPLKGQTYLDTYHFRERSMAVDARIASYMTQKYPQAPIPGPSPITKRYEVYSPFISRIIHDLKADIFDDTALQSHYSNADIHQWVEQYKYLLAFDPAEQGVDDRYVQVHPHRFPNTIQLNIYEFNFVKRVIGLFFNDRIDLSHFIEVTMPQE